MTDACERGNEPSAAIQCVHVLWLAEQLSASQGLCYMELVTQTNISVEFAAIFDAVTVKFQLRWKQDSETNIPLYTASRIRRLESSYLLCFLYGLLPCGPPNNVQNSQHTNPLTGQRSSNLRCSGLWHCGFVLYIVHSGKTGGSRYVSTKLHVVTCHSNAY